MDQAIVLAIIAILPQLILITIVAFALLALREPLARQILPRLSGVRVIGLEVMLTPADVRRQLDAPDRPKAPPGAEDRLLSRAERSAPVIRGAYVLWIDDHPEWTRRERRLMETLGIAVDPVRSTKEAAEALEAESFDLIVSDVDRENNPRAGLEMLDALGPDRPPVIFYVGRAKPGVPAGAFGLTDRPDELLHLVIDALERRAAQQPTA
jgi:CheY-like chemotaxis protein